MHAHATQWPFSLYSRAHGLSIGINHRCVRRHGGQALPRRISVTDSSPASERCAVTAPSAVNAAMSRSAMPCLGARECYTLRWLAFQIAVVRTQREVIDALVPT
jgi:hypothetical protein